MITSNLTQVLQRLEVVEQRLPELTVAQLAAIPRSRWRAVAAGAVAATARTPEERDFGAFVLQTVMVHAPRGNTFAIGASFPDSPWLQAQRAGRELSRIFAKSGRPSVRTPLGETEQARRLREAGGQEAVQRLQRNLAFARNIVEAFVHAPVTPDPEDPASGKLLDDEDRELLARPDPMGREANALMGRLMILLGFYKPWTVMGEDGVRQVSPNFAAAAASIGGRIRKFAVAHFGDEFHGLRGNGRLNDMVAAILAAWRDLVLTEWKPATARALAVAGWGR